VGFLLVIMDISGWINLGEGIGLTGVRVLAWVLGSRGWVRGTEGDGWGPWGTGEGGEFGLGLTLLGFLWVITLRPSSSARRMAASSSSIATVSADSIGSKGPNSSIREP
jgi:hypothetical protein